MWKPFASQAVIQASVEVNSFLIRFILKDYRLMKE